MTENELIGLRLDQIRTSLHLTQNELAQSLGVQKGFISNVITGKKGIGMTIIMAIIKKYPGLNIRWLLIGTGEMWDGVHPDDPPQPASASQVQEPPARKYEKALPDALRQALADQERRITRLENVVFPKTKGK